LKIIPHLVLKNCGKSREHFAEKVLAIQVADLPQKQPVIPGFPLVILPADNFEVNLLIDSLELPLDGF
jgi:hypothetical protein